MSLVHLSAVCSHLQNATRARLGTTSIPSTKLHLALTLSLLDAGFLSSVTRGSHSGPDAVFTPTTQENIASRRLWLGLKYYDNEPVLSKMSMVSKPKKRVWLDTEGLQMLCVGKDHGYVRGLRPGESLFCSTDRGIYEVRECVERRIGGMVLCRAM